MTCLFHPVKKNAQSIGFGNPGRAGGHQVFLFHFIGQIVSFWRGLLLRKVSLFSALTAYQSNPRTITAGASERLSFCAYPTSSSSSSLLPKVSPSLPLEVGGLLSSLSSAEAWRKSLKDLQDPPKQNRTK